MVYANTSEGEWVEARQEQETKEKRDEVEGGGRVCGERQSRANTREAPGGRKQRPKKTIEKRTASSRAFSRVELVQSILSTDLDDATMPWTDRVRAGCYSDLLSPQEATQRGAGTSTKSGKASCDTIIVYVPKTAVPSVYLGQEAADVGQVVAQRRRRAQRC